jgi:hypothetical protein
MYEEQDNNNEEDHNHGSFVLSKKEQTIEAAVRVLWHGLIDKANKRRCATLLTLSPLTHVRF